MNPKPPLTHSPVWQQLAAHQTALATEKMADWFARQPDRAHHMSCQGGGLLLDYSKNCITPKTLAMLMALAEQVELPEKIGQLFAGSLVNTSEQNPALHWLFRAENSALEAFAPLRQSRGEMARFVDDIHRGQRRGYSGKPFTDVVNIGIGGSDLGPLMATAALRPYHLPGIKSHFVSNIDPADISQCLQGLNPETTLFILCSKTFSTLETRENANAAQQWLRASLPPGSHRQAATQHLAAVTAKPEKARDFGVSEDALFSLPNWTGGRYSLWSAIGLSIALALGNDRFSELLAGAAAMDAHFRETPLQGNMPVIMALLEIWYTNFWSAQSHAVLPYSHDLRYLPKYLQQLDMESCGKQVTHQGATVDYQTGPILWGEAGTNGQHSFYQLLHQGTQFVPVDFILVLTSHNPIGTQQAQLVANCLSQSRTLMLGQTSNKTYEAMPGNRPSNTLVLDKLTPTRLGALIALYEHKTYVKSAVWAINAFDQWGVELGKKTSQAIYAQLTGERTEYFDASTEALMQKALQGLNTDD